MRKHFKYFVYLARHKWFVFVAGIVVSGVSLRRLLIHDWSKLLPCEWFPYADYFFSEKTPKKKAAFDRAWLHHQHANAHHWQYWILRSDDGSTRALRIPYRFACEMVADWLGAGRAITGRWGVREWYAKNKDKIVLDDETRKFVEYLVFREPQVAALIGERR